MALTSPTRACGCCRWTACSCWPRSACSSPATRPAACESFVWSAFLGCIAVSLASNIAAAPRLAWQPVLVAGWPGRPAAGRRLLAHRSHQRSETAPVAPETGSTAPGVERDGETGIETGQVITPAEVLPVAERPGEPTAQEIMWAHYFKEQARGRTPTGAELDRVAGTNNDGRTVLRQWRDQGRIPPIDRESRSMEGGAA